MKQSFKSGKVISGTIICILLIFFDQITKYFAILKLKGKEAFPIWKNVFELQYLENRGAAFGILQGKKIVLVLFTVIALLVLAFIFYHLPAGKRYWWTHVICVLFISGAIGNFIDRVYRNYVVDFFYFKPINFPIFNVADIYVVVASAMMIISIFYYKDEDFEKIFPFRKKKEQIDE